MLKRLTACIILVTFAVTTVLPPQIAGAQTVGGVLLPNPGTVMAPSSAFVPVLIKGLKIHPENPLEFDFIIDNGNTKFNTGQVKAESERLIKYFFAALTVPADDFWVNLSPHESDRVIPDELGKTELGRDLLAQDYILKQLTASYLSPESEIGKKFWDTIYAEAQAKFGSTDLPVKTFNKVWIMPESATVYENGRTAYIVKSRLKVLMDGDYKALKHNQAEVSELDALSGRIMREIVVPAIEREVNEGEHFAPVRQIYHSLLLAKWYKEMIKDTVFSNAYVDQNKVVGIDMDDKTVTKQIYNLYVDAYKKGAYSFIKEDYDALAEESIPRKYFTGGIRDNAMMALTSVRNIDPAELLTGDAFEVSVGSSVNGQMFRTPDPAAAGQDRAMTGGEAEIAFGQSFIDMVLPQLRQNEPTETFTVENVTPGIIQIVREQAPGQVLQVVYFQALYDNTVRVVSALEYLDIVRPMIPENAQLLEDEPGRPGTQTIKFRIAGTDRAMTGGTQLDLKLAKGRDRRLGASGNLDFGEVGLVTEDLATLDRLMELAEAAKYPVEDIQVLRTAFTLESPRFLYVRRDATLPQLAAAAIVFEVEGRVKLITLGESFPYVDYGTVLAMNGQAVRLNPETDIFPIPNVSIDGVQTRKDNFFLRITRGTDRAMTGDKVFPGNKDTRYGRDLAQVLRTHLRVSSGQQLTVNMERAKNTLGERDLYVLEQMMTFGNRASNLNEEFARELGNIDISRWSGEAVMRWLKETAGTDRAMTAEDRRVLNLRNAIIALGVTGAGIGAYYLLTGETPKLPDVKIFAVSEFNSRTKIFSTLFRHIKPGMADDMVQQILAEAERISPRLAELTRQYADSVRSEPFGPKENFNKRTAVINQLNIEFFSRNGSFLIYKEEGRQPVISGGFTLQPSDVHVITVEGKEMTLIYGSAMENFPQPDARGVTLVGSQVALINKDRNRQMAQTLSGDTARYVSAGLDRIKTTARFRSSPESQKAVDDLKSVLAELLSRDLGGKSVDDIERLLLANAAANELTNLHHNTLGIKSEAGVNFDEAASNWGMFSGDSDAYYNLYQLAIMFLNPASEDYGRQAAFSLELMYASAQRLGFVQERLSLVRAMFERNHAETVRVMTQMLKNLTTLNREQIAASARDIYREVFKRDPLTVSLDITPEGIRVKDRAMTADFGDRVSVDDMNGATLFTMHKSASGYSISNASGSTIGRMYQGSSGYSFTDNKGREVGRMYESAYGGFSFTDRSGAQIGELHVNDLGVYRVSGRHPFSKVADRAMTADPLGGIDMNTMDFERTGEGIQIEFNEESLKAIMPDGINSLTPVIINVVPVPNILPLLGMQESPQPELKISKK